MGGRAKGLVPGQREVDGDSKGIAGLPDLLALPALEGRTATADAMRCLKATAQAIPEGGGDHGLARKGAQPALDEDVRRRLDSA